LLGRVLHHGSRAPRRPAFRVGHAVVDYGDLAAAAARLRGALLAVQPRAPGRFGLPAEGRLLATCLGNDARFPEIFVGATAAPNAVAVLDPQMPPARLGEILERLLPDVLVLPDDTSPILEAARGLGVPVRFLGAAAREASYHAWLAGAEPADASPPEDEDDSPFLIGFTSGTTSLPKAYIRARRTWRRSLAAGRAVFALDEGRTTMAPGSLAHGLALYALAEALDIGAPFATIPAFHPQGAAEAIRGGDVRRLVVVPTMIVALAKAAAEAGRPFSEVEQVVTAGAKFQDHHLQMCRLHFPNAAVVEYYGASELGFVSVGPVSEDVTSLSAASVGRPYPGVGISIHDEDGREVPAGGIGTIHVRSPLICSGYLWGEDGQGFRLSPHGATVGDLGYLTADGALAVVGRAGGMIVSNGHNIYLSEIEAALRSVPAVTDAVALGRPDPYSGQRLVAVVSADAEGALAGADVIGWCRDRLPRHKLPRDLYRVRAWPTTSSGKIARGQVESWVESGSPHLERLDG
jgi:acyl-CoA synthetase (AMP-forming)/AMP-acid ligase II